MGEVRSYQLPSHKEKGEQSSIYVGCPNAKKPKAKADIGLLAEPVGSLAFKMVQVRQLESGQRVKLESAAGWCVFVKGQRFPCHS
ncbi:hypothetical protein F511_32573 [Dorcoceras hygrometricum]|uniref:Uncharacterized protein n=1 Tax=Dorcoceras hygrometricum TaxID=472368 RepID=A0A2Z7C594_9LAMI|nr:hypothetical protein F511_32573 [Dorcoceras hygrometricum]